MPYFLVGCAIVVSSSSCQEDLSSDSSIDRGEGVVAVAKHFLEPIMPLQQPCLAYDRPIKTNVLFIPQRCFYLTVTILSNVQHSCICGVAADTANVEDSAPASCHTILHCPPRSRRRCSCRLGVHSREPFPPRIGQQSTVSVSWLNLYTVTIRVNGKQEFGQLSLCSNAPAPSSLDPSSSRP